MTRIPLMIAFFLIGLVSISFAQAANQSISITVTQTNPNPVLHISVQNYTTPINLLNFTAVSNLYINSSANGSVVNIQLQDANSLSAMGVNVIISQQSGTLPLYSAAQIGITPATKSGIYNITLLVSGEGLQNSSVTTRLQVFNPTNATFNSADPSKIPTVAQASEEVNMSILQPSSTPATNQSQAPQGASSGQIYYYIFGIVAILLIAGLAIWLRRKA